jgi:hypothetical protein
MISERELIEEAIEALHCPSCGAVAAVQAQGPDWVEDVWACDTENCPYHWERGISTWTLGLNN